MPVDINKTLFFVDGKSDRNAIEEKFIKEFRVKPEFRLGCNGKSVTPNAYFKFVHPTLELALHGGWHAIVFILDREKRPYKALQFACHVKQALVTGINSSEPKFTVPQLNQIIHVCVADKMFENWILADVRSIKRKRTLIKSTANATINYEGTHGKSELKKIMKVPYKELTHAPILFNCVDFQTAKINSQSFLQLANILGI